MGGDRNPNEVLRLWTESAPYWEKHGRAVATMFGPVSEALIQAAGISAGDRVLDIACGVGDPTLDAARAGGPDGLAVGADPIWGMVSAARRRTTRERLHNAHFVQCSADALPFAPDTFDAVLCRFGVMFFIDPVRGLEQMLSVVKVRGRLSLAVWAESDSNPFFTILPSILKRYVSIPPTSPDAPGAFRFAEPGKLARLLDRAGATEVQEHAMEFQIQADVGVEEFWTLRSEMSDALRDKAKQLSAAQLASVKVDLERKAKAYFLDRRMSFPARILVITAVKPGASSAP